MIWSISCGSETDGPICVNSWTFSHILFLFCWLQTTAALWKRRTRVATWLGPPIYVWVCNSFSVCSSSAFPSFSHIKTVFSSDSYRKIFSTSAVIFKGVYHNSSRWGIGYIISTEITAESSAPLLDVVLTFKYHRVKLSLICQCLFNVFHAKSLRYVVCIYEFLLLCSRDIATVDKGAWQNLWYIILYCSGIVHIIGQVHF